MKNCFLIDYKTMKKSILISLLLINSIISYSQIQDSVSIKIVQPKVFVLKDKWSQQINFDINIENQTSKTIELTKIKLHIYNKNNVLLSFRELNKGAVSASIATIPIRFTPPHKKTTLYNPFTTFKSYINLYCLKYSLYFIDDLGKHYNKEIKVYPNLFAPKTNLSLPLKGQITVIDGNDYYSNHRRFDINNPLVSNVLNIKTTPNLFSIDFSITDSLGNCYEKSNKYNENYYVYGNTVYATATGKVLKTINIFKDNEPGKLNFSISDAKQNQDLLTGNCIVIDHLNGEYSFFIHLKQGSILVKQGEKVEKGQPIAQVGNSGSSMQPHLHYQLSDKPNYIENNPLPIFFHNYNLILGSEQVRIKKGYVSTGDIVRNRK